MTIRVLAEGWRNRYDRMHRSRARLGRRYERSVDYDDDLYHAVQDAWHLKDWIKSDAAIDQALRDRIVADVENERALRIIADLANCTKHLVLSKKTREGAALSGAGSTVGPLSLSQAIQHRSGQWNVKGPGSGSTYRSRASSKVTRYAVRRGFPVHSSVTADAGAFSALQIEMELPNPTRGVTFFGS
jgi:hypothetical protein